MAVPRGTPTLDGVIDEQNAPVPSPAPPPDRFLVRGRLESMPRRRADRELVLRWAASRLSPVHEPVTERELTQRLADFVRDPVGVRRDLVDAGLLTRTRDGAEYWRSHVTEFDDLGH